MRFLVRSVVGVLLATLAAVAAAQGADAAPKPIRIVHPYPGGAIDNITRVLADRLKDRWGQPIVIDPRPGASEIVAADQVAKARPDGLTWFIGTESTFANNAFLFRKLPFDPAGDLVPVSELFAVNFALIVRGDFPARTLQEFVEYAKNSPGKIKYGSVGVGTGPHLAMEDFARLAGIKGLIHVPYKTPPQSVQDLLGGEIDVVMSVTQFAAPFVGSGKMRMLAVTGATRQKDHP
ncbi:MAG: hypothetical protein JWQ07_4335, partial [Ramlibacter sp.]|nr:hypothetical protein [Ramlibacter sp.]